MDKDVLMLSAGAERREHDAGCRGPSESLFAAQRYTKTNVPKASSAIVYQQ
jgi:hypothetical protein